MFLDFTDDQMLFHNKCNSDVESVKSLKEFIAVCIETMAQIILFIRTSNSGRYDVRFAKVDLFVIGVKLKP